MSESESDALPLGDTPILNLQKDIRYIAAVISGTPSNSWQKLGDTPILNSQKDIRYIAAVISGTPSNSWQKLGDTPILNLQKDIRYIAYVFDIFSFCIIHLFLNIYKYFFHKA